MGDTAPADLGLNLVGKVWQQWCIRRTHPCPSSAGASGQFPPREADWPSFHSPGCPRHLPEPATIQKGFPGVPRRHLSSLDKGQGGIGLRRREGTLILPSFAPPNPNATLRCWAPHWTWTLVFCGQILLPIHRVTPTLLPRAHVSVARVAFP